MHEVSLGQSIQDYISGREIENTTYEDLRQGIAQLLVEEKGYPKDQLCSKVPVQFEIDGNNFCRLLDVVAYNQENLPLIVFLFCSGAVSTYIKEAVYAARLHPEKPAKLALVTDTREASLIRVADGHILEQGGYHQIPAWDRLLQIAQKCPFFALNADNKPKIQRLLYTFSELSACCNQTCK